MNQKSGILGMKSDAGLIKNIKRSDQGTSQRSRQIDSLTFSSRKRRREAIECQVTESDVHQETDAVVYFGHQSLGNSSIVRVKLKRQKEVLKFGYRHENQFGDRLSTHLDILRFGFQARSFTIRTNRFASETGIHDTVLNLILVLLEELEETIYPREVRTTFPEQRFLFAGKLIIGLVNWKVHLIGIQDKLSLKFAHLLTFPTHDTIFVDRQRLIGNDQIFINADHITKPFASRTSSQRRIKIKHQIGRLFKTQPVKFKPA